MSQLNIASTVSSLIPQGHLQSIKFLDLRKNWIRNILVTVDLLLTASLTTQSYISVSPWASVLTIDCFLLLESDSLGSYIASTLTHVNKPLNRTERRDGERKTLLKEILSLNSLQRAIKIDRRPVKG